MSSQTTNRPSISRLAMLLMLPILGLGGGVAMAQAQPTANAWNGQHSLLENSFVKLTRDKQLKIVVIGNSVTHGSPFGGKEYISYYTFLADWFRAHFPDATIEVKPNIIFAIGPEIQLFRMEEKVLAEKPDLVVVEFGAANGAWGDTGKEITDRATEGYIRRLRFLLPQTDCLMNMGLFKTMLDDYRKGNTPHSVTFQYDVAKHYDCVLTDSEKALAEKILAGAPYEQFMNDFIHPNQQGYEVHGQVIAAELDRQYAAFQATPAAQRRVADHTFPATTVHPDPWLFPRLVPAYFADSLQGFTLTEQGRVKFIAASTPGASGTYIAPNGQIVGVLMHSPEQRGNLEVRLDGAGEWVRLSQQNEPRFTEGDDDTNWYQRNFFGVYGLPLYCRRVDFRVSATPEDPGKYAVQIVGFLVIEHDAQLAFSRP